MPDKKQKVKLVYETKRKRTEVSLRKETYDRLKVEASQRGVTVKDLVDEIISRSKALRND